MSKYIIKFKKYDVDIEQGFLGIEDTISYARLISEPSKIDSVIVEADGYISAINKYLELVMDILEVEARKYDPEENNPLTSNFWTTFNNQKDSINQLFDEIQGESSQNLRKLLEILKIDGSILFISKISE
jgi:hypothetical protein